MSLDSIAQAQNDLTVHVEGLGADTVYLAHYYGAKLFYNDTAVANAEGTVRFDGKPRNEGGKYAVVLPGPKFFEFLMVEEPMEFKTTATNPAKDLEVIRSKENDVFYGYMKFIQDKRNERAPFDAVLQDSSASAQDVAEARQGIQALTDEVNEYQHYLTHDPRDFLFGKYLTMLNEPQVPDAPPEVEDKAMWQYMWYRDHYWDRVDFTDARLVRDGAFDQLIGRYWAKVLPQMPDTMIAEGHKLLQQTLDAGNRDMFKYMLHHMTYASESSKIMCMDKVFVDLVNTYYRTGIVDWLSEEQMDKIVGRADDLKHSLCGNQAPNITLPGLDQSEWLSLHDIDAKYTLLCIWESTCGHCKKEMPKLERIYETWKPRGLEIFAIGNDFEPEPWQGLCGRKRPHQLGQRQRQPTHQRPGQRHCPHLRRRHEFAQPQFPDHLRRVRHPQDVVARRRQEHHCENKWAPPNLQRSSRNLKALKKPFPTLTWTNNGRVPRANIDPHRRHETHPNEEEAAAGLLFYAWLVEQGTTSPTFAAESSNLLM